MAKTPASDTVKKLPGYPVQNSPSWNYSWGGGCWQGGNSMWPCVTGMPQKDTLDRAAYTCMLISYRRLLSQFQFSLSGVTLVYLSQWSGSKVQASRLRKVQYCMCVSWWCWMRGSILGWVYHCVCVRVKVEEIYLLRNTTVQSPVK